MLLHVRSRALVMTIAVLGLTNSLATNRLGDEGARILSLAFYKGCAVEVLEYV